MVNCSVERGKYILKITPPSTTDEIVYSIKINGGNVIFQGRCDYYGGIFEVDCSNWIEGWIVNQSNTGIVDVKCTVTIICNFYNEGSALSTSTYYKTWLPDIIDMDGVQQFGIICGGANGYPGAIEDTYANYMATVSIYPLFFFNMRCKIDGKDFFAENVMWDPNSSEGNPILLGKSDKIYTYTVFEDPSNNWNSVNEGIIQMCEPAYTLNICKPKMLFKDDNGKTNYINLTAFFDNLYNMPTIDPLFTESFGSLEAGKRWADNVLLRYNESVFKSNYTGNAGRYLSYILPSSSYVLPIDADHSTARRMTNMQFELTGYGYKTMMLYYNLEGLYPNGDYGIYTSDYVSCIGDNSGCPKANIVLVNSGFANSTNDTFENRIVFSESVTPEVNQDSEAPYDIIIPLAVKNGCVVGKTVNNVKKTTYMDRYGDYHNSVMNNTYEIECYIDPEWMDVKTGSDLKYEKIMLACQNAQKTYLCSTATISGIDGTNSFTIEGRVKDIENIETYSSYNNGHKIPSYKITFEVYK